MTWAYKKLPKSEQIAYNISGSLEERQLYCRLETFKVCNHKNDSKFAQQLASIHPAKVLVCVRVHALDCPVTRRVWKLNLIIVS